MGALEIDAKLVISQGNDNIVLVAEGNYLILNLPSHAALDRLTATSGSTGGSSGVFKLFATVNEIVRSFNLMVEVRVAGKTYVEFGGSNYKITASAVLGTLGSFLKRL